MKDAASSPALSPGGKKLVQARLPFKVVSPASPAIPPSRKRKLSQSNESASKITKPSKENDVAEDAVVISDDDTETRPGNNPLFKIADKALKKKLQKKAPKKDKNNPEAQKARNKNSKKKKSGKWDKKQATDDNDVTIIEEPESGIDGISKLPIGEHEDIEMSEADGELPLEVVITENENNSSIHKRGSKTSSQAPDLMDETVEITEELVEEVTLKEEETSPNKKHATDKNDVTIVEKSESGIDGISKLPNCEHEDVELSKANGELPPAVVLTENENNFISAKKQGRKTPSQTSETVEITEELMEEATPKEEETSAISPKAGQAEKFEAETNNSTECPKEDKTNLLSPTIDQTGVPQHHEKAEDSVSICDSKNYDSSNSDDDVTIIENEESPENTKPMNNESSTPSTKKRKHLENNMNTPSNQLAAETLKSNNVTPKRRSARTKKSPPEKTTEQTDTKNNSSSTDITTPKQNVKRSLASTSSPTSPANAALTPKQLQRMLESAKKKEEREKDKQDREKKRLEEKEERNRIKLEKEEQRKKEREEREEQKKKEREEKEEQRRKEKEEKDKQKELEKKEREEKEEQKRKEKEEKEEQRRKEKEQREEEKKKKLEVIEEEKRQKELEKQEQELKKKKAAAAFVSFFVPKQKTEQAECSYTSKNSVLSSFTVKSDMRLAPMVRLRIDSEQKSELDGYIGSQSRPKSELYLQSLRDKVVKPRRCQKTWPLDDKEEDCTIVESEDELPPAVMGGDEVIMATTTVRERLRPKLFSFHENRRPPYWGTWRKTSSNIKPRRPFGTDKKHLDYEVDSDSDWEEEGEGESIAGSVAGSVDEAEDEYEVDNDFFVPHGYLSDEEGTMDGDDVLSLSPETQKAKLKHLEEEFESEMKKPTEKLKPRLYGMLWENSEGGKPENCIDALWNYFGKMAMIMEDPTPLLRPAPEPEESEKKKSKKKKATEEGSPKTTDKRKKTKPVKKEASDVKKHTESMKNQPGINTFLTKIKT